MSFVACKHLPTAEMVPSSPWKFEPEAPLADHIRTDKAARQNWIKDPHTRWNYWTFCIGHNAAQRVSKKNPPDKIGGLAVDIDHSQGFDRAAGYVDDLPFKPSWIERSLGRKGCRLVFELEKPFRCGDFGLATRLLDILADKLEVRALPGYDKNTTNPTMLWSNGAEWVKVEGGGPVPSAKSFSWYLEVIGNWRTTDAHGVAVPLEDAYRLCKEKFGDAFRWPAEAFELEQMGPTWFIPESESEGSAKIKEHGIFTFSAHAPKEFYSWADPALLGDLVAEFREANIAKAVEGVYFDGKGYWLMDNGTKWVDLSKEAFVRRLKVNCRLSAMTPKGSRFSEVEEALRHVEVENRIHHATPAMCREAGVIEINGERCLNVVQNVVIQPRDECCAHWGDGFPFIAKFIDSVWEQSESETQRIRFLMELKRLHDSFATFTPRRVAAMFFVGPKNIGKTFLTTGIMGAVLGGATDPSSVLMGQTHFNEDLCTAPVWSLDDPISTFTKLDTFTATIKRFVANPTLHVERKFVQGGTGEFNGCVCVTMNDNATSLELLPELDMDNSDKFQFFMLKRSEAEFQDDVPANRAIVNREAPAFVRWLVDWKIPDEWLERFPRCSRWGYLPYHHPQLAASSSHGSVRNYYREALVRVLQQHLDTNDKPIGTEVTYTLMTLLQAIRQAVPGNEVRFTPKMMERYLTEFMKIGDPIRRTSGVDGLPTWIINTEFIELCKPKKN